MKPSILIPMKPAPLMRMTKLVGIDGDMRWRVDCAGEEELVVITQQQAAILYRPGEIGEAIRAAAEKAIGAVRERVETRLKESEERPRRPCANGCECGMLEMFNRTWFCPGCGHEEQLTMDGIS